MSLEETAICVVDDTGRIVKEVRALSDPEALVKGLQALQLTRHFSPRSARRDWALHDRIRRQGVPGQLHRQQDRNIRLHDDGLPRCWGMVLAYCVEPGRALDAVMLSRDGARVPLQFVVATTRTDGSGTPGRRMMSQRLPMSGRLPSSGARRSSSAGVRLSSTTARRSGHSRTRGTVLRRQVTASGQIHPRCSSLDLRCPAAPWLSAVDTSKLGRAVPPCAPRQ